MQNLPGTSYYCPAPSKRKRAENVAVTELPLQSDDDFGSLVLHGALLYSQVDFEISLNPENSFSLQARSEDITMIDSAVTPRHNIDFAFGDDFRGEFNTNALTSASYDDIFTTTKTTSRTENDSFVKTVDLDARKDMERAHLMSETCLNEVPEMQNNFADALLFEKAEPSVGVDGHETAKLTAVPDPYIIQVEQTELTVLPNNQPSTSVLPVVEESFACFPSTSLNQVVEESATAFPSMEHLNISTSATESRHTKHEMAPPFAASSAKRTHRPVDNLTIPQFQLPDLRQSQLPPPAIRGQRKRKASSTIIDDPIEMTRQDLRYNVEHAEEIMQSRLDLFAPSCRHTQPNKLISLDVHRLLALPANWETAICGVLGELWKSARQHCEFLASLDVEDPVAELAVLSSQQTKSDMKILHESCLEASKEEARLQHDTSIPIRPSASLTNSSHLDVTIRQTSNDFVLENSSVNNWHAKPVIPEEVEHRKCDETLVEEKLSLPAVDVPMPVAEEFPVFEAVFQADNIEKLAMAFPTKDAFWLFLDEKFSNEQIVVNFFQIFSQTSLRKNVAKTAHHLLSLLRDRKITVYQPGPYEEISIRRRC